MAAGSGRLGLIRPLLFAALIAFPAFGAEPPCSTVWTCEQQEFYGFVRDRFFRATTRAKLRTGTPSGFPFPRDREAMALGLIEGQQRFYPHQPDVKIRLLAFSMCETQGNSINVPTQWGREIGWTGWNINILRWAAGFWGMDFPASDVKAIRHIRTDHRYAAFLTLAACAAYDSEIGGFEHALAVKTFGFRGYGREYAQKGKDVRIWMRNYRTWLSITEEAARWDGKSPVSARLYAAMSATPMMEPDRRKP